MSTSSQSVSWKGPLRLDGSADLFVCDAYPMRVLTANAVSRAVFAAFRLTWKDIACPHILFLTPLLTPLLPPRLARTAR